jgi:hypothetical protein
MKSFKEIYSPHVFESRSEEKSKEYEDNPQVVNLINKLFIFFFSIFPAFDQQYSEESKLRLAKTQWVKAFVDAGILARDQVEYGVKKCRESKYPNVPMIAQFIEWCKPTPEQLNLKSARDAYKEACENSHPSAEKKWSHETVVYAWNKCGSYFLTHEPEKLSYPYFKQFYDEAISLFINKKMPKTIAEDNKIENRGDISSIQIKDEFKKISGREEAMKIMRQYLK